MTDRTSVAIVILALFLEVAVGAWWVWDAFRQIDDIPVFLSTSEF